MIYCILVILGIILAVFLIDSRNEKLTQSAGHRLRLVSLQVICTLAMTFISLYFFAEILKASSQQTEIIGAISLALLTVYVLMSSGDHKNTFKDSMGQGDEVPLLEATILCCATDQCHKAALGL